MNLQQLDLEIQAGRVQELNVISIEGGDYLLEALIGERVCPIKNTDGTRLRARSVEHIRQQVQTLPDVPMHLIHPSAYDEMCGLGEHPRNVLKVAISQRSAW